MSREKTFLGMTFSIPMKERLFLTEYGLSPKEYRRSMKPPPVKGSLMTTDVSVFSTTWKLKSAVFTSSPA